MCGQGGHKLEMNIPPQQVVTKSKGDLWSKGSEYGKDIYTYIIYMYIWWVRRRYDWILHGCAAVFSQATGEWKYSTRVQYPALLPSHKSNNMSRVSTVWYGIYILYIVHVWCCKRTCTWPNNTCFVCLLRLHFNATSCCMWTISFQYHKSMICSSTVIGGVWLVS